MPVPCGQDQGANRMDRIRGQTTQREQCAKWSLAAGVVVVLLRKLPRYLPRSFALELFPRIVSWVVPLYVRRALPGGVPRILPWILPLVFAEGFAAGTTVAGLAAGISAGTTVARPSADSNPWALPRHVAACRGMPRTLPWVLPRKRPTKCIRGREEEGKIPARSEGKRISNHHHDNMHVTCGELSRGCVHRCLPADSYPRDDGEMPNLTNKKNTENQVGNSSCPTLRVTPNVGGGRGPYQLVTCLT